MSTIIELEISARWHESDDGLDIYIGTTNDTAANKRVRLHIDENLLTDNEGYGGVVATPDIFINTNSVGAHTDVNNVYVFVSNIQAINALGEQEETGFWHYQVARDPYFNNIDISVTQPTVVGPYQGLEHNTLDQKLEQNRTYYFRAAHTTTSGVRSDYTPPVEHHIGMAPGAIPPTITLIGLAEVTLSVGDSYMEEGATATDVNGNPRPVAIDDSGLIVEVPGVYLVKYDAKDSDRNPAATVTRQITVV